VTTSFDGEKFGQEIVGAVRGYVEREIGDLKARIAELETRTLKYVGVYVDGKVYHPGEMTSHAGSLWHCEGTTQSKPGADASWKLAVKRGVFSK
jgi:hypothetical protein